MKSFSLLFLGFFCVFQLSAQEIPEDQFIPQLEAKQKALYELVDKKDSLVIQLSNLSRAIENIQDEAERATRSSEKTTLENSIKELDTEIVEKCDEYREYHTLLKKYQNVSDEFLAKYKVRICQIYTADRPQEEVTEVKIESYQKELKARNDSIEKLVDKKFANDKAVALLEGEITKLENELSSSILESAGRNEKQKELTAKKNDKKKLVADTEIVVTNITDSCKKFEQYKTYLKDFENVTDADLAKYKSRSCLLFEEKDLDPEKFIIVGDNEPIKKEELLSNKNAQNVLKDVFSIDSKTNLGTFEIPGDEAFINFYISVANVDNVAKMEGYEVNKNSGVKTKYKGDSHAISIKEYYSLRSGLTKENTDSSTNNNNGEETPAINLGGGDDSVFKRRTKAKKLQEQQPKNTATTVTGELLVHGGALFKSIQIELREGGIVDTRVVFLSKDKKTEFYFEGRYPVSILNYTLKSKESYIAFSHYVNLDGNHIYDESILEKLIIRYVDVLDYHPNAGSNYVPDDVAYKFPSNDDKEAKIKDRRSYQVINNNHLQNVLDLRAYTDLLGLFSDEDNGLFQIEGKADFFVNPFNVKREALYFLKKISPYVRYSRFDDDTGFVQAALDSVIVANDTITQYLLTDSKLSLLERSNLEMGLNVNLTNFRLFKESPVWTSFYLPLSYNVTKVRTDVAVEDNDANYKVFGFGLGVDFEIRRFNNFGLNAGLELKGYSFIGDYSEFSLVEPGYLKTLTANAEIFYYPGEDRSNSIFLRMRSIRDVGSGAGDAFFQLQVGYRFTLGVGAIKAR
ncbi:hypothetical protein KORDIASMS9_04431 [Kordia sp. SMS9]|uniref:coiled-coil domain-containing protein n=1 Tax=Kordia sp. SMS9 TaxID=2282170 RepID=UPI000E0DD84A|nr:hypothetical protein [Kordia sp. SMS9]AXG72163.1 hypothetical protein KORDIASMS9_04431 [Kordia sp. SMS9]